MRTVFADTFYFLALLDSREVSHPQAVQYSRDPEVHLVTTEWVLVEFGNAYCQPADRASFVGLYRSLINHSRVKIIPADSRLFQRGVNFFEQRGDKSRSLVDCISFLVMQDGQIAEVLTGDHHFQQAGFVTLLK